MQKKYIPIRFPRDESAHDEIVEWWYFNGHLKDKKRREYAFMDCLFKVDVKKVKVPVLSRAPFKQVFFSHSLVTDLKKKTFHHRIAPFSILSDDSFSKPLLYINYLNPEIKNGYTNCIIEKTSRSNYHIKNEDIDLVLKSVKKPLLEGGKGYFDFLSGKTYYYSLTDLRTKGRIKVDGKWIEVAGRSWMDHQWTNIEYSSYRWDWFSVQLDNGTDAVFFTYRVGKNQAYSADFNYPGGRQEHFKKIEIVPLNKRWTGPKSGASYPLVWKIRVPEKDMELTMSAKINDQEMLFGSINYWEGPFGVAGRIGKKTVKGTGFAELVGYPSKYTNANYVSDEIGKMAKRLGAIAKGVAIDLTGRKRKTKQK